MTTFQTAASACEGVGGHLVTITGASEDAIARSVQNPGQNPWIGATDDAIDGDTVFDWVTGEPFFFTRFAPGEPDAAAAFGGDGECLHLVYARSRPCGDGLEERVRLHERDEPTSRRVGRDPEAAPAADLSVSQEGFR